MSPTDPVIELRLRRLRNEARRIGRLLDERIALPRTGHEYRILRPPDMDLLLDRAAADPEQNLPYWCEIWPSGIALADAIAADPTPLRGQPVLEIGSGLGVTASAALAAGADLVAADYSPDALLLARHNALRNAGREPSALRLNWRRSDELNGAVLAAGFPVVIAADVLYEARDVEPLLALVERVVHPDGLFWLAEPGRPPAARFLDLARAAGWHVASDSHPGPWPDPKDADVTVSLHRLTKAIDAKRRAES